MVSRGLVCLVLVVHVTCRASSHGSGDGMMVRIMARYAADERSTDAAFRCCRGCGNQGCRERQQENKSS